MKRSSFSVLAVVILVALGAPTAAQADSEDYTPSQPQAPTLAGSTAVGVCEKDAPWISFDVMLTDPDEQVTSNDARLILTDGANTATIALGTLVDGKLAGRVLWPGAAVNAAGEATGWPGWAFQNGQWVEIDGNFAWTRGKITATIEVNPSVVVPLSYPPATPQCSANPPGSPAQSGSTTALPATGLTAAVWPIAIVGAMVVLAGLVLFLLRRRSARR